MIIIDLDHIVIVSIGVILDDRFLNMVQMVMRIKTIKIQSGQRRTYVNGKNDEKYSQMYSQPHGLIILILSLD